MSVELKAASIGTQSAPKVETITITVPSYIADVVTHDFRSNLEQIQEAFEELLSLAEEPLPPAVEEFLRRRGCPDG